MFFCGINKERHRFRYSGVETLHPQTQVLAKLFPVFSYGLVWCFLWFKPIDKLL